MASLNQATLIGHLGKDPEIRTTQSGNKIANLSVATSDSWKDKQTGERKEKTEWHTVVIFNENIASVAEKYLKKGSKLYVEGKLQTRKWQDKQGADRWTTEIILQGFDGKIILLDSNSNSVKNNDDGNYQTHKSTTEEECDEIPF